MKSWKIFLFAAIAVVLLAVGGVWFGWKPEARHSDGLGTLKPVEVPQQQNPGIAGDDTFSVEGGVATSENYMLISSPPNKK
ncbi:MAG: hypothetical protein WC551_05160 [Patescibacteria group bacterium]